MQMAISTTDNGKMIKLMGSASILIQMEPNMKDTGSMINNTVKEKKNGQMVLSTKEIINSVKRTDSESSSGLIDPPMKVTFWTTIFTDTVSINGLMEENSLEIGFAIRCMEKDFLLGPMVEDTRASIMMTKNKGTAFSLGQMEESTMALG